jgi:hypothetical protein
VNATANIDDAKLCLPIRTRLAATEAEIERQRSTFLHDRDLITAVADLEEEFHRSLSAALGSEKFERWQTIRRHARERIGEQTPSASLTTSPTQAETDHRNRLHEEEKTALEQLGIDVAEVEKIQRRFNEEVASLLANAGWGAAAPRPGVTTPKESGVTPLKESIVPQLYNTEPPFYNASGHCVNYGLSHATHRETNLGSIHTESRVAAGYQDASVSIAGCSSEIRFWFKVPETGLIRVQSRIIPTERTALGSYRKEPFFPFGQSGQFSALYLAVIYPEKSCGRDLTYLYSFEEDFSSVKLPATSTSWSEQFSMEAFHPELQTPEPFEKGADVLLALGISDRQAILISPSLVDNLQGSQFMRSTYFIPWVKLGCIT